MILLDGLLTNAAAAPEIAVLIMIVAVIAAVGWLYSDIINDIIKSIGGGDDDS